METSPDEDDVISLEIKSDVQLILSVLCETDMHRKVKLTPEKGFNLKRRHCATFIWSLHLYVTDLISHSCLMLQELFGSEGVEMVVHFLRKGSNKFYSGLGHNKLVLTTVDCVWSVRDHAPVIS